MAWPLLAALPGLSLSALAATDLPVGAQVTHGAAQVSTPSAQSVQVQQSTQRAVIQWQGFSVGQGGQVNFVQPNAQSATLNIVTGQAASTLAGTVKANGAVYLVNPQGIAITPTGLVDTRAGFVASTSPMDAAAFMQGRQVFSGLGGGVVNRGRILSGEGGAVVLLGSTVANEGLISAPLGRVALASGQAAVLDLSGDGFLQVMLPADARTVDGHALVGNSGVIEADGGRVVLKAATVRQALREAVHMPGEIRARSVAGVNGAVVLDGGTGGHVQVSGKVLADGDQAPGGVGGRIDITGHALDLQGATLSARGVDRGGLIRLGGAFQGGATPAIALQAQAFIRRFGETEALANASTTQVDAQTHLDVSASGAQGAGGTAIVWSNDSTVMQGSILATGAASAGAVEVSAKSNLQAVALDRLVLGRGGQLLLDPQDIEINTTFGAPATTSYLSESGLLAQLNAGTDVTLQASNDITWNNGFAFVTGHGRLSLSAGRSISLSGIFQTGDGGWTMVANDTAAHGVDPALRQAGGASLFLQDASFINNSQLNLLLADGAGNGNGNGDASQGVANRIWLGDFHGGGLTATVSSSAVGFTAFSTPDIYLTQNHQITAADAITLNAGSVLLSGSLTSTNNDITITTPKLRVQASLDPVTFDLLPITLSGKHVTWTNEKTGGRISDGIATISFVENGVLTRYGRIGGSDATRLALGSDTAYTRTYGNADPNAAGLGALQLRVASHNVRTADDPLDAVLAAGSLNVTGPGVTADVGDHVLTLSPASGLALDSAATGSYFIDLTPGTVPLSITRRSLSPSVVNGSYVYGSPGAITSLTGLVNGDVILPVATLNTPSGSTPLTSLVANGVGFGFAATAVPAGNASFTLTGITGTKAGNYTIDLSGPVSGTLTVSQRPLTYFSASGGQTYGSLSSMPLGLLTGVLGADEVNPVVSLSASGTPVTLNDRLSAGTYASDVTALTGAAAGNYSIASSGNTSGQFVVAKKPLTFSVANSASTYGTLATLGNATLTGVLSGDVVAGQVGASRNSVTVTLTERTPAGAYDQVVTSLTGASSGNYMLASSGHAFGTLTINPKPITYVGSSSTQTYGLFALPSPSGLVGVLSGDTVTPGTQTVNQVTTANAGALGELPVGTYAVGLSSLAGADASNYTIAPTGNTPQTVSITPKLLNYTLNGGSTATTYGTTATLPGLSLSGLVGNDAVTGELAVFQGGAAYAVATNTPAGAYAWGISALQGDQAGNYQVATTGNTSLGLTVAPRTLTWQVASGTAVYGDALNNATTFSALVPGDSLTVNLAALDGSGQAIARAGVGTYPVGVASISGALAGNYTLASSGNTTGSLSITARPVTYSIANASSVYGTLAVPGVVTLSNVLTGDTLTATERISLNGNAVTLAERSPAGTYDHTVTGLTGNTNYVLASAGNTDATLTIAPKTVTFAAPDVSSVYGTAAVYGAATLTGVLTGDAVSPSATVSEESCFPFFGCRYLGPYAGRNAGTYSGLLTIRGLTGADAGNYTIDSARSTRGTLTVAPKPLTYTITLQGQVSSQNLGSNASMPYGFVPTSATGTLTGVLTEDRFDVGVSVAYPSMPLSTRGVPKVGTYQFTAQALVSPPAGNASKLSNYVLAASGNTDATLTINPAVLNVFAMLHDSNGYLTLGRFEYGSGQDYTLSQVFTGSGTVGDDVSAPLYLRTPDGDVSRPPARLAAGSYPFVLGPLTGADAANYTAQVVSGPITVTPKSLTVQVGNVSSTYGQQAGAPTATLSGLLPGDAVTANITTFNAQGNAVTLAPRTAAGTYEMRPVSISGADAGNYTFLTGNNVGTTGAQTRSGTLSINRLTLGYAVDPATLSQTYGGLIALPSAVTGVLSGEQVTVTPLAAPVGATATGSTLTRDLSTQPLLDAGTYQFLTPLSGPDAANYQLPPVGDITIAKRVLGVTVADRSSVYGSTRSGGPTVTLSNVLPGETLTVSSVTRQGISLFGTAVTTTERTDAGTYTDWVTGFPQGATAANYSWTYGTNAANLPHQTWAITPKPLGFSASTTVTATYGTAPVMGTLSGVLFGDDVGVQTTGTGTMAATRLTDNGSGQLSYAPIVDAGSYNFTHALTGTKSSNYALISAPGQLTVDRKTLTLQALSNATGVYGSPLMLGTLTGVVGNDDVDVRTVSQFNESPLFIKTSRLVRNGNGELFYTPTQEVGTDGYVISLTPVGAKANNYRVVGGASPNDPNVTGQYTITPKPILYSVSNASGQYGNFKDCPDQGCALWTPGITLGTVSLQGVLVGDQVGGDITVIDLNGRTGTIDSTTPVGTYFQVVNRLNGSASKNYSIASRGNQPGILTIKPVYLGYTTSSAVYLPFSGLVGSPGVVTFNGPGPNGPINGDQVVPTVVGIYTDQFGRGNPNVPPLTSLDDLSKLQVGTYNFKVTGLTGPQAENYRLVDYAIGHEAVGTLSVFSGIDLGLSLANAGAQVPNVPPLAPPAPQQRVEAPPVDASDRRATGETNDFGRNIHVTGTGTNAGADAQLVLSDTVVGGSAAAGGAAQAATNLAGVNLSTQASGLTDALFSAGVTGVRVAVSANAHVDIQMSYGPASIMYGAEAEAVASARVGVTGARLDGSVQASVNEQGALQGHVNGVGNLNATGTATLFAGAEGSARAGYIDGEFRTRVETFVGVGGTANLDTGISGDHGSLRVGAGVTTPGSVGGRFDMTGSVAGSTLTVGLDVGAAIGIGGLNLSVNFSVDPIRSFDSLGNAIGGDSTVQSIVSTLGLGGGASRAPRPPTTQEKMMNANSLKDNPTARFALLASDTSFLTDAGGDNSPQYQAIVQQNRQFYNDYVRMTQNVSKTLTMQIETQTKFLNLLKTDPKAAIAYAHSGAINKAIRNNGMLGYANTLGVKVGVVDGKPVFVNK